MSRDNCWVEPTANIVVYNQYHLNLVFLVFIIELINYFKVVTTIFQSVVDGLVVLVFEVHILSH